MNKSIWSRANRGVCAKRRQGRNEFQSLQRGGARIKMQIFILIICPLLNSLFRFVSLRSSSLVRRRRRSFSV